MARSTHSGHDVFDVGIVVVTYNNELTVGALLDSLPDALDGLLAEVVVVDNGSTDGTRDLLRVRSDCHMVEATNAGYSAGINLGFRSLRGTGPVLILNPDTVLRSRSVRPLVKSASEPHVGIVAPRIENVDGTLSLTLGRKPTSLRTLGTARTKSALFSERLHDPREYESRTVVDWAVGAALLVTRACFDAVGGWDESYFLYSEETDFCLAARDRGYLTVYEPSSVVMHTEGGSGVRVDTHSLQAVNRVRLYRRRHTASASAVYLGFTALQELRWALRGVVGSSRAVRALLVPSERPDVLGADKTWIPR